MIDSQKEDLQFWFYNHVFISGKSLDWALKLAIKEVGVTAEEALNYFISDGRLTQTVNGDLALIEYDQTNEESQGLYIDMDWFMALIQDKTRLRGEALQRAVGIIYKLSPKDAAQEVSQYDFSVPIEGEEE